MADGNITVEVSVQTALTADVFEALDLRPEQFLTDGGLVNRGKLRAALWYPHDYLPEGHWMRATDAERLRSALRQLVDLEDMRLRLRQLHEMGHGTDYADYHRLLPLAWAEAREALGPNAKLTGPSENQGSPDEHH